MKMNTRTATIYVAASKTANAGRGVFASEDISRGSIIEICPTIELTKHDTAHISESMLATYLFFFGETKEQGLLVLGYGSLYNHSHTPNAIYQMSPTYKTISFIANKDIKKDSEITFDYATGSSNNKNPLWFEVR